MVLIGDMIDTVKTIGSIIGRFPTLIANANQILNIHASDNHTWIEFINRI